MTHDKTDVEAAAQHVTEELDKTKGQSPSRAFQAREFLGDPSPAEWQNKLTGAYSVIGQYLARDGDLSDSDKINMDGSPKRAAKALMEMTSTRTEIAARIAEIIDVGFPTEKASAGTRQPGIVFQGAIRITSLCPHHWLTVEYDCHVAYIPAKDGKVLGLSKLARLAQELGHRPVLQEQLGRDIADVLFRSEGVEWPSIESSGSAVLLIGHHSCMSCRGVKSDAATKTPEMRGDFWDRNMEDRFYNLVRINKEH